MEKLCTSCGLIKDTSCYSKEKRTKDGFYYCCLTCKKAKEQIYRENNRERIRELSRKSYKKNQIKSEEQINRENGLKKCSMCKIIKKRDEFYTESSGNPSSRCKICLQINKKEWEKNNRDKCNARYNRYYRENPLRIMVIAARARAKRDEIECTITQQDLILPEVCPILGIPIIAGANNHINSPSLDRIDNSKGYVKENVILVSYRANSIKNNASLDDLNNLYEFYNNVISFGIYPNYKEEEIYFFHKSNNEWYKKENSEFSKELRKEDYLSNPVPTLLYHLKSRAKKKGLEFNLDASDIKIPFICPALKIPIIIAGENNENCPSIDRIDNTKGYVKGNIVIVSYKANRIKGNATLEELKKIKDFYAKLYLEAQIPYQDNCV